MSRTDQIKGIIVRATRDGQLLKEFRYPNTLRRSWDEGSTAGNDDGSFSARRIATR